MKLKDIKVNMEVIDKYGNEYIVTEVDESKSIDDVRMPVRLKSIKILRNIAVSKFDVTFNCVGQVYWIYKSKKMARRDGFYEEDVITVKSLKPKGKSK